MRLSPSGRRVAYVQGYGLRPPQPRVTVRLADDTEIAIGAGHSPRWVFEDAIVYGPQEDGPLLTANAAGLWAPVPSTLPSGHVVTAAAGRVAVSRTDPRRILLSWWRGDLDQATDPALSDDGGWLASLRPDQPREGVSTLVVEPADLTVPPRVLATGGPTRPRFGSRTLCWEDAGRIYGVADVAHPASPVVDLTLDGWQCSHPVPVWVPARGLLFVALVRSTSGTTGQLVLREWAEPRILELGSSGGAAFDHDCRPVAGSRDARAVWLTDGGQCLSRGVSLDLPRAFSRPPERPRPEPDEEFQHVPGATVTGVWDALVRSVQARGGVSPDGRIAYVHKSDERPDWGEWWDRSATPHPEHGTLIGHLEDASTGLYLTPDRRESISAQEAERRGLNYGRLDLSGYHFDDAWRGLEEDGGRLWLLDEVRDTIEIDYLASLIWRDGRRERTPVRIKLTPGRGVYRGVLVQLEQEYDPRRVDAANPRRLAGFLEVNHYTVSAADRFWVRHAYYQDDAEGRRVLRGIAQLEEQVSARGRLAGLRAAGVRILDAPLPRHRLLSDDALEAA